MGEAVQVLVAEDDRDIGELIARYVQRNGWTVRLVTSGTEALSYAKEHAVDLLILDLMLPGMSGLDVPRCAPTTRPPRFPSSW